MTFTVEINGMPHYADINPPPAGTVFPPNSTPATVAQVEDRANTNALYDSNSNTWVVSSTLNVGGSGTNGGGANNNNGTNGGAVTGGPVGSQSSGSGSKGGPLSWPGIYSGSPTPMTFKKPSQNVLLPNPLNLYASYTYGWSLWWLDVNDYNKLTTFTDVASAQDWTPSPQKSFVIAEDGGRFADQRLPTTSGLNYNIQNVTFTTTIAPNKQSQSTNLITGKLTIKEPYGVTLIDALVLQSFSSKSQGESASNYLDQPYMLQLDFFGYDDAGAAMPSSSTMVFRKRFPIKIIGIKLDVGTSGAEYTVSFTPLNHIALHEEYANIPKGLSVSGGTVGEVFTNLAAQLKQFWSGQASTGVSLYADGLSFDFDESIAKSKIVFSKDESITEANPQGVTLDLTKKQFNISEGTKIIDLITRVVATSEYVITQLKTTGGFKSAHTNTFNAIKIQTGVQYGAQGNTDTIQFAVHDLIKNQFPKIITFKIHQNTTWLANHPALDQAPDSTKYSVKRYDYLYSGHNVDIIGLKLNFDTTYYTQVLSNKKNFAAYQASAETKVNSAGTPGPEYSVSPTLLGVRYPALTNVINISPARYIGIVNDQNLTTWGGILNSPLAQVGADVFKSLYTQSAGDMIVVDLTIRGDPHLIKQDDWFYIPSPTKSSDYTAQTSNTDFATKFGFIRMDTGDVVVGLNIYTPIDQDADLTGVGLMYWMGGSATPTKSLFSGQYRILTIVNKFENGKFEQVLKLARYQNGDMAKVLAGTVGLDERVDNVLSTSTSELVQTNNSTVTTNEGSGSNIRIE
jgi:hypothetical protein